MVVLPSSHPTASKVVGGGGGSTGEGDQEEPEPVRGGRGDGRRRGTLRFLRWRLRCGAGLPAAFPCRRHRPSHRSRRPSGRLLPQIVAQQWSLPADRTGCAI